MSGNSLGQSAPLGDFETAQTITVTVTNASSLILAANDNRRLIFLNNRGNRDIFLNGGSPAIVNAGVVVLKGNSILLGVSGQVTKEAIFAIVQAGTADLSILEAE